MRRGGAPAPPPLTLRRDPEGPAPAREPRLGAPWPEGVRREDTYVGD